MKAEGRSWCWKHAWYPQQARNQSVCSAIYRTLSFTLILKGAETEDGPYGDSRLLQSSRFFFFSIMHETDVA